MNAKSERLYEIMIVFPYTNATKAFFEDQDLDGIERDHIFYELQRIWVASNEIPDGMIVDDSWKTPVVVSRVDPERMYYFRPEITVSLIKYRKNIHETFVITCQSAQEKMETYFHDIYSRYQIVS